MSTSRALEGSCLCGATGLVAQQVSESVGACHCGTCRRWGGAALMAVQCGTEVELRGEDIAVFDSSEWAERGFCRSCGTHLFYRLKADAQYIVPVGLFGDETFVFDHQVFIDHKPEYYDYANETENMTGEELFAKFI